MQIEVKWLFADRVVSVQAFPSDTLEIVKARVMRTLSLPNYMGGFFIFKGQPLSPNITVQAAGIKHGDKLELNGF